MGTQRPGPNHGRNGVTVCVIGRFEGAFRPKQRHQEPPVASLWRWWRHRWSGSGGTRVTQAAITAETSHLVMRPESVASGASLGAQ